MLDSFHHRCIQTVLGITNKQQWEEYITSQEIRQRWGDLEAAADKVCKRRLEWLGHLARMPNHRIPKMTLFGWLPQPRPQGGPRRRWRDTIRRDLKHLGIPEDKWYGIASTSRSEWQAIYHTAAAEELSQYHQQQRQNQSNQIQCEQCLRKFRRESDRKRHKCTSERRKPISEQRGAAQCPACKRWFLSRGGLSVHRCTPTPQ